MSCRRNDVAFKDVHHNRTACLLQLTLNIVLFQYKTEKQNQFDQLQGRHKCCVTTYQPVNLFYFVPLFTFNNTNTLLHVALSKSNNCHYTAQITKIHSHGLLPIE